MTEELSTLRLQLNGIINWCDPQINISLSWLHTHTILSDLSKGQGTLCRHEQIKVSRWLNLIRVAKQQQSDLGRVRTFFTHSPRPLQPLSFFQWTSLPGIHPLPSCQPITNGRLSEHQFLGVLVGSAVPDSLDLLQVCLYCLRCTEWAECGNMRKIEPRTNTVLTDVTLYLTIFDLSSHRWK